MARYELLKVKPVIYERGFQLEVRGWSQAYVRQIDKFGWTSFCHPRTDAVLPWVYEFYTNAKFHTDEKIHIRGKEVDFSAEGINSYFDLTNLDCDVFQSVRTSNPYDIATTLSLTRNITWVNESSHVLHSALFTREAKVWLIFVNSSVMPTKHSNHVSFDRACIIHSIIKGILINVGHIISSQILKKVKTEGGTQLRFPTLITSLCRYAGVSLADTDTTTILGRPITFSIISSYIRVSSEEPPPKSAQKQRPTVYSSKTTQPPIPPPLSPNPPDWPIIFKYLQGTAKYQRQQHRDIASHLNILHHNQVAILRHLNVPEDKIAVHDVNPAWYDNKPSTSKGKEAASSTNPHDETEAVEEDAAFASGEDDEMKEFLDDDDSDGVDDADDDEGDG
ncbi:hypothetical protein KSP40_PGU004991 [Platanthera guangdongensis]|uniref:Putative plant transposon protein domain-containing protein n=1 Tax=Platanthera guangdongensis TaxID=2320717 RepID=A0ABR2LLB4_9ASPA